MSRIVAYVAMVNFCSQMMVPVKSTLDVKDLNGKKVAITAAGSGSDLLALWTIQDREIEFTRVPVGGGGPGAQPARRQCGSGRGLFAAQLPDRQIRRSPHHPGLFQGSPAESDRGLDR